MSGDVEARVVGAFEQAAGLGAQGNGYLQMARSALQMFGADFVARVGADERVALGLPIQPFVDGKSQPGALLLLEHRALVAWAIGTLRPRTTVVELPLDGSLEVESAKRKAGRLSAKLDALTVTGPGLRVEFAFYSMLQEERLTHFVTMNLNGALTFNWDDESAET